MFVRDEVSLRAECFVMTPNERALLLGLAEEIVLNLRSRLSWIENPHPGEPAPGAAALLESLRNQNDERKTMDEVKPQ